LQVSYLKSAVVASIGWWRNRIAGVVENEDVVLAENFVENGRNTTDIFRALVAPFYQETAFWFESIFGVDLAREHIRFLDFGNPEISEHFVIFGLSLRNSIRGRRWTKARCEEKNRWTLDASNQIV
jgi:hypothetical protein